MKDFRNNKFGGGNRGGGFGGKPSFGGGSRDSRGQMFKAVCAECGKSCEVPFKPNGQKPVYCNDCFGNNAPENNTFSRGGGQKDFRPKPSFAPQKETPRGNDDVKRTLDAISAKLDRLVGLMEKNASAPVKSMQVPIVAEKKEVATPSKTVKAKAPAPKKTVKAPAKKVVVKKAAPKAKKK